MLKFKYCLGLLVLNLFFWSCAGDYQRAPSGGDDDLVQPIVEAVYPKPGAVNQSKDLTVKIEFSEFVKYASTNGAISISPLSAEAKAEINWGERSVEINFNDLAINQTVLVIVGTSLTDLRNNRLRDNFILPFSTGAKLDSAVFRGQVYDAIVNNDIRVLPANAIKIQLHKSQQIADSGYFKSKPEYEFGLGEKGKFNVGSLTAGVYNSLIFHDKDNNGKLGLDNDEIFTAGERSVNLDSNKIFAAEFVLGIIDTIPPFIKEVNLFAADMLSVKFSKPILTANLQIDSLIYKKRNCFKQLFGSNELTDMTIIQTDSLEKGQEAELFLRSFIDAYGNKSLPQGSVKRFLTPDSIPVVKLGLQTALSSSITADDSLKISLTRPDIPNITIHLAPSLEKASFLDYTIHLQKKPFSYKLPWENTGLPVGDYRCLVKNGEDTLYLNKLNILPKINKGFLSGKITKPNNEVCNIIVKPLQGGKSRLIKTETTSYKISLLPGLYRIAAYLDINRDDQYNPGGMAKNLYAEPALVMTDTIQIRKNWEQNDYNLIFKINKGK